MPNSVILCCLIELALILVSCLLLIQPLWLFRPDATRLRKAANWGGIFFLVITFCWSIVLGVILAMSGISVRI